MRKLVSCRTWLLTFLLMLYGCAPLIGPYSATAYENATSLKADVLTLLAKAESPYAEHAGEIDEVIRAAERAYQFVKGVPGNDLSAKQWEILKDPNGELLGKFFKRWRERSTLSRVLIEQYSDLAGEAFDEIICLEANKKATTACKVNY
ncbi:MAG: hypothetical protein ACPG4U_16525 [Pseudomonadales bacterium]